MAKIQDNGLARDLDKADKSVKVKAANTVRAASFAVEKRVKIDMPVDKGRARASWGHWTPSDVVKHGEESRKDAHWAEKDDGLTIEQGSNVWYIVDLNQGSSRQAPAGFIDKAADAGARVLTEELEQLLGEILE
jgi:hypothetical protein